MKILYRPEIDGLRAISVFAVILYHADFILFGYPLFQGGFIGVDIFFVISSYLITTLILKEILKTNQFSFKFFYERRIRRILPALLFVTIISSIISYFILLPSPLIDFGKSIFSIIFFSSNFYFWFFGTRKYGEESELLKPSLHTWSLSVEEQFYILFPIFLIITVKFFRKYLLIILFLTFLISLIFSEYSSKAHPSFNFYILFSRGFEFLIGSLLSYFQLNNFWGGRKSYNILNKIFPSLGIILILYSFLFFNFNKIFHPSIITLVPLIGVSLIIWFSKKEELITQILSSKIFIFFGLISYSLYLWHYPIFAFFRNLDLFNNSIQIKLLAILSTIILSILSWHYIERPFRKKNITSAKILTVYVLISVIVLFSYSFYILRTEGIKNRLPNHLSNLITVKLSEDVKENELNRVSGNQSNVLLIGDSHAHALTYYLNKELTQKLYNFYELPTPLYLKNFNNINRKDGAVDQNYYIENEKIHNFLEKKNLIVVWHQRWSFRLLEEYFDNKEGHTEYQHERERYLTTYLEPINIKTETLEQRQKYITQGIKSSADRILEEGHALILVYPVPEMGFDVKNLILKKYSFFYLLNDKKKIKILSTSYDIYKDRNKMIFNTLDSINHPKVYRVYPHKSFCNNVIINRCVSNNLEHVFYYDNNHLSLEGSKYIVNDIIKKIGEIEVDKKINK